MIDRSHLLKAMQFRHACKEFDPTRPISEVDFELILEAGRLSPSSFGYEPWQFVVIQNPALRQALLPVTWGAQKTLPTASHFVAILARRSGMLPGDPHIRHMQRDVMQLSEERITQRDGYYQTFLEADFRLLDHPRGIFEWSSRQAYIALANMMTVAALRGVDSCPIEGFVQDKAERILNEAGILETSEFGLAVMVAFGYRINPQPNKTRRPGTEVIRWV